MSFHAICVRLLTSGDEMLHRRRHYGMEPRVRLDCGRQAAPAELVQVDSIDWNSSTACPECYHHLLTLVDGEGTTWREAPTTDGKPSNGFYIGPEVPEELTPLAEIVRDYGLREVT